MNSMEGILSSSIPDSEFIRGNVPMTKEEIRQISISKLRITEDALVYDVGSGTGSVAVSIAGISDHVKVYAIERKPEAVDLIRQNCDRFGRKNVTIVEAEAPDGLDKLPVPTHAFIGGSGGHLREILSCLYRMNPTMRIVINAVSMETVQECVEIGNHGSGMDSGQMEASRKLSGELECDYQIQDYSMVQIGVTRLREVGSYHMMQGENPVWICSFQFRERH